MYTFNSSEQKVLDYVKMTGLLKLSKKSINVDQIGFNFIVFWLGNKGLVADYSRSTNGDYLLVSLESRILDFCK